tara:strand:+ start:490 stop:1278 length:789 start_codon:yes stop_codon:yes gene_type:complete
VALTEKAQTMTDYEAKNSLPKNTRDDIFANTLGHPGLFAFNETVVGVFPDMIRRSVPGYTTVIGMTGILAARHARPGTRIYDLGCSLGASLLSAAHQLDGDDYTLIGIDNSPAMLSHASKILSHEALSMPCELIEGDITTTPIENASVVIMNYTLQFVPVEERDRLLRRIRDAMQPGDALILSEKLTFEEPMMNGLMINLHEDFKRAQGYSDLEVAKKRQALENVLIPESREAHIRRIRECGFSHCDFWFQCFNFGSLVAIA